MSEAQSSFLVLGEALVDIVVPADGGESHEAVGGSCLNVAVGLARLGVPTTLATRIGDDEFGKLIVEHAHASGVLLADDALVEGGTTSTATARLTTERAASYDFDIDWDLPVQLLSPDTFGMHVGSLGTFLEPGKRSVVDLARQAAQAEVFVSYDPNIRPFFLHDPEAAWHEVREIAACSRLVKLSDEDLRLLRTEGDSDDHAEAFCRELLAHGRTELVILTRGDKGARAFGEGLSLTIDAPPTDLVDSVGAGDSFMAAMVALLDEWGVLRSGEGALRALDETRVELLVRGAAVAAAITCSRRGANPPTRAELPAAWPAQ